MRSQFDSDHCVDFSAPTCCQSAIFVRPLFAFYCPLFFKEENEESLDGDTVDGAAVVGRESGPCFYSTVDPRVLFILTCMRLKSQV